MRKIARQKPRANRKSSTGQLTVLLLLSLGVPAFAASHTVRASRSSSLIRATSTGVGTAKVEASIGAQTASTSQVTVTSPKTVTAPSTEPITVAISPSTVTRRCLTSVTFTGKVTNTANTAVEWSVNDIVGGNNTLGTITSTGVYT